MPREVHRVLIVEDEASLRRSLEATLAGRFAELRGAGTAAEACRLVRELRPDLLLLDVALPDGSAFDVLDAAAEGAPAPVVVAMSGSAEPDQSFELARRGVRVYLKKPIGAAALEAALSEAVESAPDLRPQLRASVGHRPLRELEGEVRKVFVDEALARSQGSVRGAARLLAVSRQLLQHILRRRE